MLVTCESSIGKIWHPIHALNHRRRWYQHGKTSKYSLYTESAHVRRPTIRLFWTHNIDRWNFLSLLLVSAALSITNCVIDCVDSGIFPSNRSTARLVFLLWTAGTGLISWNFLFIFLGGMFIRSSFYTTVRGTFFARWVARSDIMLFLWNACQTRKVIICI